MRICFCILDITDFAWLQKEFEKLEKINYRCRMVVGNKEKYMGPFPLPFI